MEKRIAIVMGSKSDMPIVDAAIQTLKEFGVGFSVRVLSAHRTPDEAAGFARRARGEGFGAIIAVAGKAAALPGALAACSTLPVIGVPVKSSALDGMDALLSMVQMPPGIPVATVAIDGAKNAALLAMSVLSVADEALAAKLDAYRKQLAADVFAANVEISQQYS